MQPAVTCINSMQPKHGVLAAETESEDCCSMQSILLPECVVRVLSDFGDFRDPKFSFTQGATSFEYETVQRFRLGCRL